MIQDFLEAFDPRFHPGFVITIAFLVSFFTALLSYPAIINVASSRNLVDGENKRSSHKGKVTQLGGVGIYLGLVLVITTIGAVLDTTLLLLLLGGMTILFFLGLKDDLYLLSPRKKFIGQVLAAGLFILFVDMRIKGLSGLFEINVMPYWLSVAFTLFLYLLIINAYNLIDGIDGLAGGLALVGSVAFGIYFLMSKDMTMVVVAAAMVGTLMPFLRKNLSKRNKMFMGDTGSMLIGLVMAVFTVRLISVSELEKATLFYRSAPALALAAIFLPLLDTLRIFIIRIFIHKKSPFVADKNHIHHQFLNMGYSHAKTSLILVIINTLLIGLSFALKSQPLSTQLGIICAVGSMSYILPFMIGRYRGRNRHKEVA
ncbi:glycosyltransferase family 4 protein [Winogradskyella alexanderae]|uniref:Undecaprenyl/decaprenyl-phosphate alpha-N-acetylglucosaminyl 1-phosphate transferase n=1 Tax=Winogradskyella alexanderae TaxID=2877123 RepID=A0ABS7XQZ9_9FLAO|nr:MraY family glycosyltransferase [Winogradskyella alexanderae]MCA0132437.1 undecaprenyl/decaprenyl-phosphate alpha-N-acetylglucosaminyl 1-phosphate transferase [Winogradskyella alexanderae]